MPFNIIRNNIVRMEVDAIVNAANPELEQGGGVCGRIFAAAGVEEMAAACDAIDGCPTGEAVITPGFNLPAKFVIHTVGPVWQGGKQGEEALLRSAYRSSLELAAQYNLESVAFPLISSGSFRYSYEQALAVALDEINRFLFQNEMQVILVMFDQTATALGFKLRGDLKSYIDDHYVDEHRTLNRRDPYGPKATLDRALYEPDHAYEDEPDYKASMHHDMDLEAGLAFPKERTFSEAVLSLIDARGMTD